MGVIGPVGFLNPNAPMPVLLDENGFIYLMRNRAYDDCDPEGLRLWCHKNARYGLPTEELVAWLRDFIGDRKAIEIGAGSGDLAFHLGIKATDNHMQSWPMIRRHYHLTGQPTVKYGSNVEKIEALEAIKKYQPEIVIGSWVTQWCDPKRKPPPGGGNAWGIKENEIVASGVTYVLIGNSTVHGGKEIMKLPHDCYAHPFLRSRSQRPEQNRVWIWN